ncbi:MAG TPA: hypothetical protein DFS52_27025 [Myxococcales bacterium]|nr:hypothetical protein [Myxococcales bacterium]
MLIKLALVGLVGLTATAEGSKWEEAARTAGVTVYARDRASSEVKEIKAVGEIAAPPPVVLRVLADYERYKEIMPYTDVSTVVATEKDGKVVHFYTVVNAPLVSKRDYTLHIEEVSDWREGKGYLKTQWRPSEKGPGPKDGYVRVEINEGSWTLEPLDGGARTRATYLLYTNPGGSLPTWVINKANRSAIPDIFEALRKYSKEPKYADKK